MSSFFACESTYYKWALRRASQQALDGLGDLKQAEGTVGFQRAFLAKGARSILVSLWSVDDKATALLMDGFYTHWLGPDRKPSKSKAEALRQAQSDVRSTKGYESPKYWAAFQLVGAR